jgi:hypothetical protein
VATYYGTFLLPVEQVNLDSIAIITNFTNYTGVISMFMGIIIEMVTCLFLRSVFIFDKTGIQWTRLGLLEWIFMILGPIDMILYGVRYIGGITDENGYFTLFVVILWDPFSHFLWAALTCSVVCSVEDFKQEFQQMNKDLRKSSQTMNSEPTTINSKK